MSITRISSICFDRIFFNVFIILLEYWIYKSVRKNATFDYLKIKNCKEKVIAI